MFNETKIKYIFDVPPYNKATNTLCEPLDNWRALYSTDKLGIFASNSEAPTLSTIPYAIKCILHNILTISLQVALAHPQRRRPFAAVSSSGLGWVTAVAVHHPKPDLIAPPRKRRQGFLRDTS